MYSNDTCCLHLEIVQGRRYRQHIQLSPLYNGLQRRNAGQEVPVAQIIVTYYPIKLYYREEQQQQRKAKTKRRKKEIKRIKVSSVTTFTSKRRSYEAYRLIGGVSRM